MENVNQNIGKKDACIPLTMVIPAKSSKQHRNHVHYAIINQNLPYYWLEFPVARFPVCIVIQLNIPKSHPLISG
jgi:hypothetical protein